ncbi:MAG: hypothetical protein SGI97_01315 [candidate division Zixibacteria bacterium]|nr:hypothetical protein [candidate division Zixibacteria bacterium]
MRSDYSIQWDINWNELFQWKYKAQAVQIFKYALFVGWIYIGYLQLKAPAGGGLPPIGFIVWCLNPLGFAQLVSWARPVSPIEETIVRINKLLHTTSAMLQ